jgi:hypothetical protein
MLSTKRTISPTKCLQSAKMLVPKFSFQHEGNWHIQWPKDNPHVVHAETEKQLVIKLAVWLQELGRANNKGKHVKAEYP